MEVWKDIEEFKGLYQVSDLGNIRSIERKLYTRVYPSQLIKKYPHKVGNEIRGERVHLRSPNKSGQLQRSVAKLVLLAFNGKPPKQAKQVIHIDGNPLNNALCNLKWDVDKSYMLPINETALNLFNEFVYKYVRVSIYKSHKNFYISHKNNLDDIIQEIVFKIYNVINCIDFSEDKTISDKQKHFYCFCRLKTDFVIKRILNKENNRPLILTFSEYNSIVGDNYQIEDKIGKEDIYDFESEIDIDELSKKYNIKKEIILKSYKKEFGENYDYNPRHSRESWS